MICWQQGCDLPVSLFEKVISFEWIRMVKKIRQTWNKSDANLGGKGWYAIFGTGIVKVSTMFVYAKCYVIIVTINQTSAFFNPTRRLNLWDWEAYIGNGQPPAALSNILKK